MTVSWMSSKHLIAALLLVAICFGALVFYEWRGEQIDLSFETISQSDYGGYENHEYLFIENSEDWGRIWSLALPDGSLSPEINFSTHIVIAVFMGERSTGGYEVSIDRITDVGGEIIVNVDEIYPGRIFVTEAFTWPRHIIKVERVQKPIWFEVQQFLAHSHDKNENPYDGIIYELLGKHRVETGSSPPEPSV
jgi:hypothetical protein